MSEATGTIRPSTATATVPATNPAPPAIGKVTSAADGKVVFAPTGTSYELHLAAARYAGPLGRSVKGVISVKARKVWTVPSGGNFIAPIFGSPRIIQGRVKALDPKWMVVQAGTPVWVELPDDDIVYDLAQGPIRVGGLVNVTAFPGGTFEVLPG